MDGFRGVIELFFVRMKLGLVEEDIGLNVHHVPRPRRRTGPSPPCRHREVGFLLVGEVHLQWQAREERLRAVVVQEKSSQLPSGSQWVEAGRS